jgi:hypothetical protein
VRAVVITTINEPTVGVEMVAALDGWETVVVGDLKTPKGWACPGATYLPYTDEPPRNHYARKNLGYLYAMQAGAECIAETDDDNLPYPSFLKNVAEEMRARTVLGSGWVNVYRFFTYSNVWPRGFPLQLVTTLGHSRGVDRDVRCPIQQYLADGDPDVDAIYRLTRGAPVEFHGEATALGLGQWCPFNSQNTVWWPEAYPYLYLPRYATFRMTDIWRSFIAQRCITEDGHFVGFGGPTVRQERNPHMLLRDFEDEIPGYLHNAHIVRLLAALDLSGLDPFARLVRCYEALIAQQFLPPAELLFVEEWCASAILCERDPEALRRGN